MYEPTDTQMKFKSKLTQSTVIALGCPPSLDPIAEDKAHTGCRT